MRHPNPINYLEIPAAQLNKTKAFFTQAFGWLFTDYGTDYSCFTNAGIAGGFYRSSQRASSEKGGVLIVIYAEVLETAQANVIAAGGHIIKPIFEFPGGRRFHFTDPSGNEFAVWSE
jgi:uncharacterized protein